MDGSEAGDVAVVETPLAVEHSTPAEYSDRGSAQAFLAQKDASGAPIFEASTEHPSVVQSRQLEEIPANQSRALRALAAWRKLEAPACSLASRSGITSPLM